MADKGSPLALYLATQVEHDREMAMVLRDAANEAETLMTKLGTKYGIGSEVRRAQISLVLRELRGQQGVMWGNISDTLSIHMDYAADAAAEGEEMLTDYLFRNVGGPIPELQEAYRAQARATVSAYKSRLANNIPLSQQVYRTSALANGYVDRSVNRGILLGKSAKEIAADVKGLINPNTPGGVSYAAMRLGRSELNNAFHTTQIGLRKNDPFVTAMKWNLSESHPKADNCNDYAENAHFDGGGAGEYRPIEVPGKPHPHCFCYLTSVSVSDADFVKQFINGDYNSYIDQKVYTHLPKSRLPC